MAVPSVQSREEVSLALLVGLGDHRPPPYHRRMDFDWPDELRALQAEAEDVAGKAVATYGVHDDGWINGYSREFSRELGRRGWIGMTWPEVDGGHGRTPLERFIVTEALIKAGAPIAGSWFADRQMGPSIVAYGTDEQKKAFLPGILSGESGWCIGMSEPNAGSDLASLGTRAVLDGDEYVVDGQKIWTSFAKSADYCYLICRTSTDGPKHTGLSELIVPMASPGITVNPIPDMTTNRHFCEVFFDRVRVPAANLVGQEGGSFKQTMRQLEHERGGIDRLLSNHALYLDAKDQADTSDPLVRQEIARLETAYRLGRLLVLRETLKQAPPSFSAATKTFCTEHEQRVAAFATRVAGPDALVWGRMARGVCYSPAYTIMGGTSNVLRNIIGERVLGLPREPS
jgi:alkylation response protein AidB-like acyl-CoA dehydrogenase